jgi:hypothetical protein
MEARGGIRQTPLHVAAALHAHKEVAELLLRHDGLEEPAVKAARFEGGEKPLPDSKNRI